ncbi:uncharacterized protein LOC129958317 isoform X1 [Argiope bruennichi]|uniref:uncharacterized protein LOC129958317 isoform X1 n=1 Tax=Argiope bruennichi TaxID=94029 RepID=UPI002494A3C5|nr:uncharacterized protein LOC129958317 isoform X1 [Argiope bruennichi]
MDQGFNIMMVIPWKCSDVLQFRRLFVLKKCLFTGDPMQNVKFKPQLRKVLRKITIEWQILFITSWTKKMRSLANKFLSSYIREKIGVLKIFRNHNTKLQIKCDIQNTLNHQGDHELNHVLIGEDVEQLHKNGKVAAEFNFGASAGQCKNDLLYHC